MDIIFSLKKSKPGGLGRAVISGRERSGDQDVKHCQIHCSFPSPQDRIYANEIPCQV